MTEVEEYRIEVSPIIEESFIIDGTKFTKSSNYRKGKEEDVDSSAFQNDCVRALASCTSVVYYGGAPD